MSDVAKIDKYPVITPETTATPEGVVRRYVTAVVLCALFWLLFSALADYMVLAQILCMCLAAGYHLNGDSSGSRSMGSTFLRSHLDLKAKGLDIRDPNLNALMPWDWLTKVEIRQKKFSIIPNYVYFKFKDRRDVLILWDDVRDKMDSTTLISCVRTWAPHAEIKGDAKLTKSESIASYTELWLKEMTLTKGERRIRHDQTLAAGTVLSESYTIERVLSGGGQGTAYLASVLPQTGLAEMPPKVVLKELILPDGERGLKRATDGLVKEVAILRRITHPRIIRLYDFFIEDMRGYLVIEFIDGPTLRQLVLTNGPMPAHRVAVIGASLCEALAYLHGLSPPIMHGDVTPDNIMVEKSGSIKLMDFDASQELTRNKTNTVVGKHAYMSPEQFKGVLGETSDIYALGCTLHYLLTGHDPEPITECRPAEIMGNVGEAMNKIVSQATKFNQAERFSNLNEMRQQLERL